MRGNYIKIKDNNAQSAYSGAHNEDQFITNALISKATSGSNVESWKDIKPVRNYNDIKKKAFIDQKKRDFQEMKKNDKEKNSESVTIGYKRPKYYTEGNKNSSPTKPSSNPLDNEKDAFKK